MRIGKRKSQSNSAKILAFFIVFVMACVLVIQPVGTSSAADVGVLAFVKPTGNYEMLPGITRDGSYYRVNTLQYPVIGIKQSNYLLIWKESWNTGEQATALDKINTEDSSVDGYTPYYYAGYYTETAKPGYLTNPGIKGGSFGNYYIKTINGIPYMFIEIGKISHLDFGQDPNYISPEPEPQPEPEPEPEPEPQSGFGNLIIEKELDGYYPDWNVDNLTVFKAKIEIVAGNVYGSVYLPVVFNGSEYLVIDPAEPSATDEISFTKGQPAIIKGIPVDTECVVVEVFGPGIFTTSYDFESVSISDEDNAKVIVLNDYSKMHEDEDEDEDEKEVDPYRPPGGGGPHTPPSGGITTNTGDNDNTTTTGGDDDSSTTSNGGNTTSPGNNNTITTNPGSSTFTGTSIQLPAGLPAGAYIGEDGFVYDASGTPLGQMVWNPDTEEWEFIPLANIPQAGGSPLEWFVLAFGLFFLMVGMSLRTKEQKE